MRSGPRLALFAVVLAAVFGVGAAIGAAVGPIEVGTNTDQPSHMPDDSVHENVHSP